MVVIDTRRLEDEQNDHVNSIFLFCTKSNITALTTHLHALCILRIDQNTHTTKTRTRYLKGRPSSSLSHISPTNQLSFDTTFDYYFVFADLLFNLELLYTHTHTHAK